MLMKRLPAVLALSVACAASPVWAANTDPFDFDYTIVGDLAERPALVFNDGTKTYLQPRAGQAITATGGHREGPYVVVDGTPASIDYTVNGRAASAQWKNGNTFIGGPGTPDGLRADAPAGFAGFSGRLMLVGTRGALAPVRTISTTLPVAGMTKALVPQGWSGSAQKEVDLTTQTGFATRDGENWIQALDRLMTQTNLYAEVDFTKQHIRLLRDAPKSGALNLVGRTDPVANTLPVATETITATAIPPEPAVPVETGASLLASVFGAQAIRDGDDAHIQIRFNAQPPKKLTFRSLDDTNLHPDWDEHTHVVTIDRAASFVVSDGTRRVRVDRQVATVYQFDANNAAHLEAVFDAQGATYFKFAPSVVRVNVTDQGQRSNGAQKGRYYRFNGVSDQFTATADGAAVTVTRRKDVRFTDKESS